MSENILKNFSFYRNIFDFSVGVIMRVNFVRKGGQIFNGMSTAENTVREAVSHTLTSRDFVCQVPFHSGEVSP